MTEADPLAQLGGTRQAYVLPQYRVLYISVAKNACTSVKWMLANLAGEDPSEFAVSGLSVRLHAEHGIHDRYKFQHVPLLNQLDPSVRQGIRPDNGWFVFALIRDPRSRMFSAWQQKFLLREPAYSQYLDEPWHPRLPLDADSIAEDFARFVDLLDVDPPHRLMTHDAHFSTQTDMLRLNAVPYSRIYDVREMNELTRDLSAHLVAQGHSGALTLPRSNDTPLKANAKAFPDDVRAKAERIYARDFETLDNQWDFATIAAAAPWSAEALRDAFARAEMAQRFTEVRRLAMRSDKRVEQVRERNRVLKKVIVGSGRHGTDSPQQIPLAQLARDRLIARLRRVRRRVRRKVRKRLAARRNGS